MAAYYFGGVNACGKSTIVGEIARTNPNIQSVHTTSAIMEQLGLEPNDYDTLRSLPDEVKNTANDAMLARLVPSAEATGSAYPGRHTMFDSHYLNMVEGRVNRLVTNDAAWPARLGGFVLVTADRDLLLERIDHDATRRPRHLFPSETTDSQRASILDRYIDQTQEEFERLVGHYAVPGIVLVNNGTLYEPVTDFQNFITTSHQEN